MRVRLSARSLFVVATSLLTVVVTTRDRCPKPCECPAKKRTVDCFRKSLRSIPATFPTDTDHLNLTHNSFSTIPKNAFTSAPNLNVLAVSYGKVNSLDEEALHGLSSLKWFYCSNNDVETLASKLFRESHLIERIFFNQNRLKRIEAGTFRNLTNLQHVELSYNFIEYVDADGFGNNPNLTNVYLTNNSLKRMDIFPNVPNLNVLALKNNRLTCDCRLIPLSEWIRGRRIKTRNAACFRPPDAAGRLAFKVSTANLHCWSAATDATTRFGDEERPIDDTCTTYVDFPYDECSVGSAVPGRVRSANCREIVCGGADDDVRYYLNVNVSRRNVTGVGNVAIVATICVVVVLVLIFVCAAVYVVKTRNRKNNRSAADVYKTASYEQISYRRRPSSSAAGRARAETTSNSEYEVNSLYGFNED